MKRDRIGAVAFPRPGPVRHAPSYPEERDDPIDHTPLQLVAAMLTTIRADRPRTTIGVTEERIATHIDNALVQLAVAIRLDLDGPE